MGRDFIFALIRYIYKNSRGRQLKCTQFASRIFKNVRRQAKTCPSVTFFLDWQPICQEKIIYGNGTSQLWQNGDYSKG